MCPIEKVGTISIPTSLLSLMTRDRNSYYLISKSCCILGTSYWQPMVARQFLKQSPFSRGGSVAGGAGGAARLVPQASSASLQPAPARRRSPPAPRRTASFRRGGAREVKFAETAPALDPPVWRGPRRQPDLVPLVSRPFSPTSSSPVELPWPKEAPRTTDF